MGVLLTRLGVFEWPGLLGLEDVWKGLGTLHWRLPRIASSRPLDSVVPEFEV